MISSWSQGGAEWGRGSLDENSVADDDTVSLNSHPLMSVYASLQSLKGPITLLLVIFGPSLLPSLVRRVNFLLRDGRLSPPPPPDQLKRPKQPMPNTLKLFLVVHTLFCLIYLIYRPFDLFVTNRLPITASNDALYRAATRASPSTLSPAIPGSLSPLTELLLQRLRIFDNRLLYFRFGHEVMCCAWCAEPTDYLLYSLPGILQPYAGELVVLGLLGLTVLAGSQARSKADRWRSLFAWALGVTAALDIGLRWFYELRISNDGNCLSVRGSLPYECSSQQLHTLIDTIRGVLLLATPIVYAFLPSAPPSPIGTVFARLVKAQNTLRLASVARDAIDGDPTLRDKVAAVTQAQVFRDDNARSSAEVRQAIQDWGVEEAAIRERSARFIQDGWAGLIQSQRVQHPPVRLPP